MAVSVSPRALGSVASTLLARKVDVEYSREARNLIAGKRIIVTGAGGSIGSEIVRQLTTLGAERVFMLDHDESVLHALPLELVGHGLLQDDSTVLCDIRDRDVLLSLFAEIQPELVFHAAAHKHLPLLERYPSEGIKTNVLGTRNVAEAARAAGATHFINVSTDKAARPMSVLGSTKRLAENVVRTHGEDVDMCAASVRFGNVLGSRGSFLPTLMWQVEQGHSITITDERVTRFFMTIPEAAGLVIEAATMAMSGETYVLDMGEPVRIVDLVDRYVEMSGHPAPAVKFTGLRPGEKLHEELLDDAEIRTDTPHPRIWVVEPRVSGEEGLATTIADLELLLGDGAGAQTLRDFLNDAVAFPLMPETVAS